MRESQRNTDLTSVQEHILRTLLYFDIFHYPLKENEIFKFLGRNGVEPNAVAADAELLVQNRIIFRFGELFSLHNDNANVLRRIEGNRIATQGMKIAEKMSRKIGRFPFIEAVMVSGSLSKDFMDRESDIDFFIITKPGRLWFARTMLILYKRIFLGNSHKHFCVNYFIDTDHLEIEEKNLFTATEVATLIPMTNGRLYRKFIESNKWIKQYFPNFEPRETSALKDFSPSFFEKIADRLIKPFSQSLEKFFMGIFKKRWQKHYSQNQDRKEFELAFKSKDHVSKHHPNRNQHKVLGLYDQKLREFSENHDMGWNI
jgi:hypothetical protein